MTNGPVNILNQALPEAEWIVTTKALRLRFPILGSHTSVWKLLTAPNGLPHRKLGGRLLFNVKEVSAWLNNQPAFNLAKGA